MKTEIADKYTQDLFETFDIKFNHSLASMWSNMLEKYPEEVVKSSWLAVVSECRTGSLPELKWIRKILDNNKLEYNRTRNTQRIIDKSGEEITYTKAEWGAFIKHVLGSWGKMNRKELNKSDYHKGMADYYDRCGIKDARDSHLEEVKRVR